MTITTFENLQKWFTDSKGAEDAPHWNLYGVEYGTGEKILHRFVQSNDLKASSEHLREVVKMLNNPDGSRFKLTVYPSGKHNNPTASVYVQIFENGQRQGATPASIGALPAGFVSSNELDQRLENERLKWKVEQLEQQLGAPQATWERVMEHVSGIQGIDKVLQAIVIGLVSKFSPTAMPAVAAAITGTPENGEHETDGDDPNHVFMSNIQQASAALNVDPVTMAKKLNQLIRENPELAKTMMAQ